MKKLLILPIFLLLITSCGTSEVQEKQVDEENTEVSTDLKNTEENNSEENINETELSPDEEKMINDILDI